MLTAMQITVMALLPAQHFASFLLSPIAAGLSMSLSGSQAKEYHNLLLPRQQAVFSQSNCLVIFLRETIPPFMTEM